MGRSSNYNRLAKMVADAPMVVEVYYKDNLVRKLYLQNFYINYIVGSSCSEDSNLYVLDTFPKIEKHHILVRYKEAHGYFDFKVEKDILGPSEYY